MSVPLPPLPPLFVPTTEAMRTLACYAVSPARKAITAHIDLRAYDGGFGTPPFDDGSRIVVRGDGLQRRSGDTMPITTVRAAAAFLGIEPSPDPGVGKDVPPFEPDGDLSVDAEASLVLGRWYAFADEVLSGLAADLGTTATVTEHKLWPEHFDLAVVVTLAGDTRANVGFSPGDSGSAVPYVYVGPYDLSGLDDPYWNASFGAMLGYGMLTEGDAASTAAGFIGQGLRLLGGG